MQKEKVKIGEMVGIYQALHYIAANALPVKTFYWLNRVLKKIDKEFATFEESRKRLVEQYCRKDGNGVPMLDKEKNVYDFEPACRESFDKEFSDFISEIIEIDVYKFSIDAFGDLKIPKAVMDVMQERFFTSPEGV